MAARGPGRVSLEASGHSFLVRLDPQLASAASYLQTYRRYQIRPMTVVQAARSFAEPYRGVGAVLERPKTESSSLWLFAESAAYPILNSSHDLVRLRTALGQPIQSIAVDQSGSTEADVSIRGSLRRIAPLCQKTTPRPLHRAAQFICGQFPVARVTLLGASNRAEKMVGKTLTPDSSMTTFPQTFGRE